MHKWILIIKNKKIKINTFYFLIVYVSVGDLEKYSYCPLSWWLSKEYKIVSKNGIEKHKEIEQKLKEIKIKEKKVKFYEKYILFSSIFASIIAISGLAFLHHGMEKFWNYLFITISLIWLLNSSFFLYRATKAIEILQAKYEKMFLISSMGATLIAFFVVIMAIPANPEFSKFLEILALVWITIANIIFYRLIYLSEDILVKKIKYVPLKSKIEYIGANKEGKEIISEKYGIRGKPDYILCIDDDFIPVEEKSANLQSPPLSHVIQVTAYCMLVEDKYGKSPPYGIIKYKENQFKIPYEIRWKNMVIQLRKKLLKDLEKGEAHRNHFNKRKCLNCVRREFCKEKLI